MLKKLKSIITLSVILIPYLFPLNILATSLPFYDNFSDGNASGWEEHIGLGGSWTVTNGEYIGSVNYNSYGDSTYALAGDIGWTNYSFEVKVRGILGVDKKIKFRYKSSGEYYELNLRSFYNDLAVKKISPYGWLKFKTVENSNNVDYNVKVNLNGSNIKIYINDQLKFDYTDTMQPILNGNIGLEAWPGAGGAMTTVAFDDVKVTALDPTPDNFLPIPYFSQRDPLWSSDEYDHASNWIDPGEENIIDWWGCALTSSAMVARYFGINKTPYNEELNPGTLNRWMKDQNDASFRNGAMNWQTLSRMSAKTAELFGTNKLDFSLSKVANNFPKLDEILTKNVDSFSGLPAILEVPHPVSPSGKHFLIAKGRSGATFGINDPYDDPQNPTRKLLSINPYNDSFSKLLWYEPTHSNLSTIFLVVNNNINISMLGPDIQPIGEQFPLYSLGADGRVGGESGEILKSVYLDKPISGNYSIGLSTVGTTPQPYQLDFYLYDKGAEVKMVVYIGWVNQYDQDNIYLNFDSENVQNSQVSRWPVSFETLREDISLSHLFGWIESKGITTGLLAKVDAAENVSGKGGKRAVENILGAILTETTAQEGKNVDYLANKIIKDDIATLLSEF